MTILAVFLSMFAYIYEDADSLIVINDSLAICGYHVYQNHISIENSRLTISKYLPAYDTTGWLYMYAPSINIQNNTVFNGAANGYYGGTNSSPNGLGPGGGYAGSTSGGGGGGGAYGGNGGNGGGSPGAGGNAYGNAFDTLIYMGSGGGAGRLSGVEGFGGAGGACLTLHANSMTIDSVSIDGNGQNGDNAAIVAGGGGAGGGISIRSYNCTLHNIILNGTGGNGGASDGYGGGGGGGGRVKIFYSSVLDTSNLAINVNPGIGGNGSWENGDAGLAGSIYFGYDVFIHEATIKPTATDVQCTIIMNGCLVYSVDRFPSYIEIFDITGKIQSRHRLSDKKNHISLNHLPAGVYFIRQEGNIRKSFTIMK